MPQTMALVCFLKSVVALAEGTRRQRGRERSQRRKAEIKIFTGERGGVRLRETAGIWMVTSRLHRDLTLRTMIQEVEKITLHD